mgnify:CR=1 FL=1
MRALRDYPPSRAQDSPRAQLLHKLRAVDGLGGAAAGARQRAQRDGGARADKGLVVTALDWNKTGHTLAAALGRCVGRLGSVGPVALRAT